MSQDLTLNIKTTSDVPQAMDKAKAATVSFGKQVDDIQKKFSTGFKDVFLGFLAPMVLLQGAIGMISAAIDKNRQQLADAKGVAESGGNRYMRQGTVTSAQEAARRRQEALDRQNAKLGAEAVAREQGEGQGYGGTSGKEAEAAMSTYVEQGQGFFDTAGRLLETASMGLGLSDYAKNEDIQKILEQRAAGRAADDPAVIAKNNEAANAAAQKASDDAAKAKGTTFKGPEGFSNVVGVGANPVIEAMTMQLEETRKQTALLEMIANPGGGGVPIDFTKVEQTTMTT